MVSNAKETILFCSTVTHKAVILPHLLHMVWHYYLSPGHWSTEMYLTIGSTHMVHFPTHEEETGLWNLLQSRTFRIENLSRISPPLQKKNNRLCLLLKCVECTLEVWEMTIHLYEGSCVKCQTHHTQQHHHFSVSVCNSLLSWVIVMILHVWICCAILTVYKCKSICQFKMICHFCNS